MQLQGLITFAFSYLIRDPIKHNSFHIHMSYVVIFTISFSTIKYNILHNNSCKSIIFVLVFLNWFMKCALNWPYYNISIYKNYVSWRCRKISISRQFTMEWVLNLPKRWVVFYHGRAKVHQSLVLNKITNNIFQTTKPL